MKRQTAIRARACGPARLRRAFLRITLPLSMPGVIAGSMQAARIFGPRA
jgi:ABC-type spermidine/putrescine transport system permease subunit I